MTDTALLWLAAACLAGSLAFGVAELVIFRRVRRLRLDAYQAQLRAEQAAYLARIDAWMKTR
jgi:hypothetical protein